MNRTSYEGTTEMNYFTFIVLLVWATPMGNLSCTKFAIAAENHEQAVTMAHVDVDSIPDIVAAIKLQRIEVPSSMVLLESNLVGNQCNFGGASGSPTDD